MGGLYGNEFDFPEWNIVNDLNAAQITFKRMAYSNYCQRMGTRKQNSISSSKYIK